MSNIPNRSIGVKWDGKQCTRYKCCTDCVRMWMCLTFFDFTVWDTVRQTDIINCNKRFSYHLLLHTLTCLVFKVWNLRDLIRTCRTGELFSSFAQSEECLGKILSGANSSFVISHLIVRSLLKAPYRNTKIHNREKSKTFRWNTFMSKPQRGWKTKTNF